MARYLIDENLPRMLAARLREIALDAVDVRDLKMRGATDRRIADCALSGKLVLVTGDVGFADLERFRSPSHFGLVLVRLPNEWPVEAVLRETLAALGALERGPEDLNGAMAVIEPGRIRLRQR